MSDTKTPRSDEAEREHRKRKGPGGFAIIPDAWDFARQLETELTDALAKVGELELEIDELERRESAAHCGWNDAEEKVRVLNRQLASTQAQLAKALEDSARFREAILQMQKNDVPAHWSLHGVLSVILKRFPAIDSASGKESV